MRVVKGEYKGNKLDLVHFRYKEGARLMNGPRLAAFRREFEYLVFLKKEKNGQFVFVSGQVDPSLSVLEDYEEALRTIRQSNSSTPAALTPHHWWWDLVLVFGPLALLGLIGGAILLFGPSKLSNSKTVGPISPEDQSRAR